MDLKILLGFMYCAMVYAGGTEDKGLGDLADSHPTPDDDSDMYMEPLEDDHQPSSTTLEAQAATGNWYPTFLRNYDQYEQPPSGHSRPFWIGNYQQQEGAYSQRNDPPSRQDVGYQPAPKYNGLKGYTNNKAYQEEAAPQPATDKVDILGDGNFGVIQGGTFYPEKDGYDSESSGFDDFSSYFHNGHGRPSYFYPSNPKAGKQQQQFENFRDFADINAPTDRQYSQYVVVYTNKNGTRTSTKEDVAVPNAAESPEDDKNMKPDTYNVNVDVKRPKNILESLALLDSSAEPPSLNANSYENEKIVLTKAILVPLYNHGDVIEIAPEKKLSKSKRKLAKFVPDKKHEARLMQKAKDMNEPLLALS